MKLSLSPKARCLWPTAPGNRDHRGRPRAGLLINVPCLMMQSHPALAAIQTLMDNRANHLPSSAQGTDWKAEIILAPGQGWVAISTSKT